MSDALSKVFDVTPVEVIDSSGNSVTVPPDGGEDEDHTYARARHYELAEKGSEALDLALRIARESENPRAIEVLGCLIKNLSDVNKALLSLNKDKVDIKAARKGSHGLPNTNQGITQHNNIIFSGSSKDLNKLIAEQLKNNQC